jgi:hypothetical protein
MLAVNAEMQIMLSFFLTYQTKWQEINGNISFIERWVSLWKFQKRQSVEEQWKEREFSPAISLTLYRLPRTKVKIFSKTHFQYDWKWSFQNSRRRSYSFPSPVQENLWNAVVCRKRFKYLHSGKSLAWMLLVTYVASSCCRTYLQEDKRVPLSEPFFNAIILSSYYNTLHFQFLYAE